MTAPHPRPRIINAAFWMFVAAAVLLVLSGLLIAITSAAPYFYRGAGALFASAGFGIGYLAGRIRQGDRRFRRWAVLATIVLTLLLVLFAIGTLGYIWVVAGVFLVTAAVLATRPAANEWFDTAESPGSDNG
jgi:hypothetical protein